MTAHTPNLEQRVRRRDLLGEQPAMTPALTGTVGAGPGRDGIGGTPHLFVAHPVSGSAGAGAISRPVPASRGIDDFTAAELTRALARALIAHAHRVIVENYHAVAAPVGGIAKRILDLVMALSAAAVLLPVGIMVALAIRITMGGPVVYAHERVGYDGRRIRCYKFRTMVTNADDVLRAQLLRNPALAQEWRDTQKLREDPRVTMLGKILRKSSLDELPQLINVIRGEMSCVGPRPVTAAELERYGEAEAEYLRARPGVTGLWQVSGRNRLSYAERVELDKAYVQQWSMWGDMIILLRTIPAVLNFDQTS